MPKNKDNSLVGRLENDVLREYDLRVFKVRQVRRALRIETNRGSKLLKAFSGTEQQLLAIYGFQEYLLKNGFPHTTRFIITKYGEPFVRGEQVFYYLCDWLEARETKLKRIEALEEAAQLLARFHQIAATYPNINDFCDLRSDRYQISLHRLQELVSFGESARNRPFPTEFDRLFSSELQGIMLAAEQSAAFCEHELPPEAYQLCHGRFSQRNLLRARDGDLWLVDFNHLCFAERTRDLARLLDRNLAKYKWDYRVGELVINAYQKIQPLDPAEISVLLGQLTFPTEPWQLANWYYDHAKDWTEEEFFLKLHKAIIKHNELMVFLPEFAKRIGIEMPKQPNVTVKPPRDQDPFAFLNKKPDFLPRHRG